MFYPSLQRHFLKTLNKRLTSKHSNDREKRSRERVRDMELEVRVVGGIESCFVSLPLSFIQTLQSTSSNPLPPVLALELRSPTNHDLWHVAWSGSASSSSAIEVAQQLAECISLPNDVIVQVRAVTQLTKATMVSIEPNDEDDWEILELNSEHAEAAILKQVGIVHEGMRFPLWLHNTVVLFLVVSTCPKKSVVQLVPGTEVAVAPKRRKTDMDSCNASYVQPSENVQSTLKALLRVQDPKSKMVYRCEVNGIDLNVVLTSVVLIHPETAKYSSFDNLQLVNIVPRKENTKNRKSKISSKNSSTTKEVKLGALIKEATRHAVVRLVYSELVAQGHIMIPQCLQLYLRAGAHSWIYVKRCNTTPKKDIPSLTLSPCRFKLSETDNILQENGSSFLESHIQHKTKNTSSVNNFVADAGITDWSIHEEVCATLSSYYAKHEVEDTSADSYSEKGLQSLLLAWCIGQLEATANMDVDLSSLILGNQTLVQFEVIGVKSGNSKKDHFAQDGRARERPLDILFLLSTSVESSHSDQYDIYEVSVRDEKRSNYNMTYTEMPFGKLNLADPIHLGSVSERLLGKISSSTISSLSWMGSATSDVINRLTLLLSPESGKLISSYKLPLPGHVLIYGPSGCGKTSLVTAVAKSFEEHEDILAHIVFISCSRLALEKAPAIQQAIKDYMSDALEHSPSLVIFDDLDSIVSSSSDIEGSQPSTSTVALVEFFTDLIDEYGEKRQSFCGIGPVAFVASIRSLESLPQSLSSSGRFDFHVQLPVPAVSERGAILKHEIQKRSLQCSEEILLDIASKCDGYDAYDLETLVDRTVHAAISRFMPCNSVFEDHGNLSLIEQDFSQAMQDFLPVSMRDISKSVSEGGSAGWVDVGGLVKIRDAIQEMVELPARFPSIFKQAPLRLRSNVLLYGPPGCGKTHIVGATAASCSLRFISVKGPELLNKYIGASEQAVRDVFSKAAAAAPCLLFFDEFDSIAPKRGHDNTGVTDRVVNQFLTELDGVEVLTGVFVFAATSRPDLLDAALLRPGRLDRLLFCDFPTHSERFDILKVLSRKLPLASDVDLDAIASVTEGFSGADLQALLSDAQLASVHEILETGDTSKMPVISDGLLKNVATKTRPSVSESEKRRLYGIYSQFLDSKKSVAAQSRDAKGKRATLA